MLIVVNKYWTSVGNMTDRQTMCVPMTYLRNTSQQWLGWCFWQRSRILQEGNGRAPWRWWQVTMTQQKSHLVKILLMLETNIILNIDSRPHLEKPTKLCKMLQCGQSSLTLHHWNITRIRMWWKIVKWKSFTIIFLWIHPGILLTFTMAKPTLRAFN